MPTAREPASDAGASGEAAGTRAPVAGVGRPRRARTLPPPPTKPEPPGVAPLTEAPSEPRRPQWGAVAIGAAAVALLAFVVVRAGRDGGRAPLARVDAGVATMVVDAGEPDRGAVPGAAGAADASEASGAEVAHDGGVATSAPDAAGRAAVPIDATADYKEKVAQAKEALADGDYAQALVHAEASVKLRRTARGYIMKADALRRLTRIDEALAAADAAIRLQPTFAPAWETKGKILWSERRYAEARPVYERFLELQPRGEAAQTVRALLAPKPTRNAPPAPEAPSRAP